MAISKAFQENALGALILAAINQFFSLLDPQIFRLIIDRYASKINDLSRTDFLRGVILLLLASIKSAEALSIIDRGNKGLDTKIGEGGLKISGGERQRLAIARALLRDPELLIFDEATSSLDSITEKEITKTIQDIEKIKPDLIKILVAHRLSTIAHADRIYVLEKGRVAEIGDHQTLLAKDGLYHALWREQQSE